MGKIELSILVVMCFFASTPVIASEKTMTCLFESKKRNQLEGKVIQTCLEVGTSDRSSFLDDCRIILDNNLEKIPDLTLTIGDSCPPNPVAKCTSVLGSGLNRYHYGSSNDYLKKRKVGCEGFGGKWQQYNPR